MKPRELTSFLDGIVKLGGKAPPVFIWGGPGIGKSSITRQVATANNLEFIDLRLLLLDPTDLRGLPFPKEGYVEWLKPSFFPKAGRGILFLDELNLAPILVQNSALQLVLDRKIGEHELPADWLIMAAGNREFEAIGAHRMSPPLLDRFEHVELEPDHDDWTGWAIKNGVRSEVIGFIQFRPNLLYKFDPQKHDRSFPTPRSWVQKVSKLLDVVSHNLRHETISGAVGEGAATEFMAFLKTYYRLPDLNMIFAGEDIIPAELDLRWALITALAEKAETAEHFTRLIDYAMKLPKDFGMFLSKLLWNKNKKMFETRPNWRQFQKHFRDIIL